MEDQFDGEKLREALQTGEPDRLRAAFERHFDAMSRLVRASTGRSEPENSRLIESVWVAAVADSSQGAPPESARAWLFTRLLDALGPAPEASAFLPSDDPWEGHWTEFPVPWRADSDGWERTPEGHALLERTLDRLPALERTVLILRDLDGWSVSEVAALTQLMPDEQREVLHRARLVVRAAIDPLLREPAVASQAAGDDGP